jgi:molybdopterin-binding protein
MGFRHISGRNQLIGRVIDLKISGLMAQVSISIGGQHITSIVTADAVREMRLKKGETVAALVKSTECKNLPDPPLRPILHSYNSIFNYRSYCIRSYRYT